MTTTNYSLVNPFHSDYILASDEDNIPNSPTTVEVALKKIGYNWISGYASDPVYGEVRKTKIIKIKVWHSRKWRKSHLKKFVQEEIPIKTTIDYTDFGRVANNIIRVVDDINVETSIDELYVSDSNASNSDALESCVFDSKFEFAEDLSLNLDLDASGDSDCGCAYQPDPWDFLTDDRKNWMNRVMNEMKEITSC